MRTRSILVGLVAVAIVAVLALVVGPKLAERPEISMPTELQRQTAAEVYWPTEGWRTSTPEDQGLDSAALARGLQKLHDDGVAIDSLLIIRHGYIVLDAHFQPYDGSFAHNMASVTKSITTTLVGIAAGQGKLDPAAPMISFFPRRSIDNLDARKKIMTIINLASMANGLESGCLNGDEPTLNAMRSNADWVRAALNRKMARDPGLAFCYDSPGMHILSAVIQETTGMTELEFGNKYLFEPLGIREVFWPADPQGYTHGWGDLHLRPQDAAKIGYLFLHGGAWDGQQPVPADWAAAATSFQNHAGTDDYGYGWWIADDSYFAAGRGGQYIRVYPAYDVVVVATASQLDFKQLEPLLQASFVSPDKPLAANPEGVAQLNETVATLGQAPDATVTKELPTTAGVVSGKSYKFGADAAEQLNVTALRFDFKDTSEAMLEIQYVFGQTSWKIGLDGTFRQFGDGMAARGYWEDPQTFIIETFDIGTTTYRMHFDGDRLLLSSPNFVGEYEGVVQQS